MQPFSIQMYMYIPVHMHNIVFIWFRPLHLKIQEFFQNYHLQFPDTFTLKETYNAITRLLIYHNCIYTCTYLTDDMGCLKDERQPVATDNISYQVH